MGWNLTSLYSSLYNFFIQYQFTSLADSPLFLDSAFRHAVYCRAVQKFLVRPEGGGFTSVEFIRVEVNTSAKDWRVWESKGLRYWHLNAYYLPLCWMGGSVATNDNDEPITQKEDMVGWMIDGILRGIRYHGNDDSSVAGEEPLHHVNDRKRRGCDCDSAAEKTA
jgi:hypothetical protein